MKSKTTVLNPKALKELLNLKDEDIKHYSIEQLRDMLGVFHFLSRLLQREINVRCTPFSIEKKSKVK